MLLLQDSVCNLFLSPKHLGYLKFVQFSPSNGKSYNKIYEIQKANILFSLCFSYSRVIYELRYYSTVLMGVICFSLI